MAIILRVCLLGIFFASMMYPVQAIEMQSNRYNNNAVTVNKMSEAIITNQPLHLDIVLKRTYLDGSTSEERVQETIWALEDFWAQYADWELIDMNEDELVFRKYIQDISPILKMNGFFGITNDGTLTIFNGKPEEEDIIQSFFQIDVKKLEGKKHLQLIQGIPVKSKEEYEGLLETMKQYSIENDS